MFLGVRLNNFEQQALIKIVKEVGEEKITSTLLKRLALRDFVPLLTAQEKEMYDVLSAYMERLGREVRYIGKNLNQVIKKQQDEELSTAVRETLSALKEILGELKDMGQWLEHPHNS